jgi:hypothetical protein
VKRAVAASIVFLGLSCIALWRARPDGDVTELHGYGHAVLDGRLPYRDFPLEYPPGSIPLFTLPALGEYVTWYRVENLIGWALVLALTGVLLAGVYGARRWNGLRLAGLALVPFVLGPLALMRFDPWPTALVLAALLALLRRRPTLALALLAVGALVKTWPLLLVPLFLVHGAPRRSFAVFAGVFAAGWLPFALLAHAGAYNSAVGQVNRHLEFESVGASILFALDRPVHLFFEAGSFSVSGSGADAIATVQSALQVIGVLAVAWLYRRSGRRPSDLAAAAAATVAVLAVAGKVLSPQYLIWVAPFAALCDLPALALFAVSCLAARALTLAPYRELHELHTGSVTLLAIRNAFLVATAAALVRVARA